MAALLHIAHSIETVFIRYEGHHTASDILTVYDELDRNEDAAAFVKFFVDLSGVTSHELTRDEMRDLQRRVTACATSRKTPEPHPMILAYFAPTPPAQQVGRICTGRWNLHPDFISITSHLCGDCATMLNVPEDQLCIRGKQPFVPL